MPFREQFDPQKGWVTAEEKIKDLEERAKRGELSISEKRKLEELQEEEENRRKLELVKPETPQKKENNLPDDYRPGNYL